MPGQVCRGGGPQPLLAESHFGRSDICIRNHTLSGTISNEDPAVLSSADDFNCRERENHLDSSLENAFFPFEELFPEVPWKDKVIIRIHLS